MHLSDHFTLCLTIQCFCWCSGATYVRSCAYSTLINIWLDQSSISSFRVSAHHIIWFHLPSASTIYQLATSACFPTRLFRCSQSFSTRLNNSHTWATRLMCPTLCSTRFHTRLGHCTACTTYQLMTFTAPCLHALGLTLTGSPSGASRSSYADFRVSCSPSGT